VSDEAEFVQRELTGLCVREHKTFLDVHACSAAVSDALDGFATSLDELFNCVPDLEDECHSFARSTSGIQSDRTKANLVLDNQDNLIDLLEVPQLANTYVRNGHYQEASDLTTHIERLAIRYTELPIVTSIARIVDNVMLSQLSQLLAVLREPVKLPTLARAVGFLRKMDRLSEYEIRLAFLEGRADYMRGSLRALQNDRLDPVRYIRKYIDLFRESVYDTVSQYNSIFLDTRTGTNPEHPNRSDDVDLVPRFAHNSIENLAAILERCLPLVQDSSSLSSLLTQLGYSTVSFSRLGMDFTPTLRLPFEAAIENLVTVGWKAAATVCSKSFENATRNNEDPGSWLCVEAAKEAFINNSTSPQIYMCSGPWNVPPEQISLYPPIAIFLNGCLSALNTLRLLAPIRSYKYVADVLLESISKVLEAFLLYAKAQINTPVLESAHRPNAFKRNTSISNQGQIQENRQARTDESRKVLLEGANLLLNTLVPFLTHALRDVIYGDCPGSRFLAGWPGSPYEELKNWVATTRQTASESGEPVIPIAPTINAPSAPIEAFVFKTHQSESAEATEISSGYDALCEDEDRDTQIAVDPSESSGLTVTVAAGKDQ
jgi:hypothetical protein